MHRDMYYRLLADNRANPMRRFEAVQATDGSDEATLYVYDAIVADQFEADYWGGVAPETFVKTLIAMTAATIHLRVNSPGGNVFSARTMEQALREHPSRIVTHIDGVAASAASFLPMGTDEIVIGKGAMVMIHNSRIIEWGTAAELRKTADLLDKVDSTLVQTYADRTKTKASAEQIAAWMAAETWFTSAEAVAAGLADSVAEVEPQARGQWNLAAYGARAVGAYGSRLPVQTPAPTPPAPSPNPAARIDAAALLRRLQVAALTA